MSIGNKGENLIFLISTPRTGSTLLQTILGNHPEICTLPEPWIALPTLYGTYSRQITRGEFVTEYNPYWARHSIRDFVKKLPRAEEDYYEGVRRMYSYLYECAMDNSGKKYFLDKGPRYFHIIPELRRVFPEALFVILLRNPMAVLCSMIFLPGIKGDIKNLNAFRFDLIKAPKLLLEGVRSPDHRHITIRYENLLKDPSGEIKKICESLKIEFLPEMLKYTFKEEYANSRGYENQVKYKSGIPDVQNTDKWVSTLKDPQVWRLVRDYMEFLGKDTIDKMGYSYIELRQVIDARNPGWFRLINTRSLFDILKKPMHGEILNWKALLEKSIYSDKTER